jgi:hypothetical protein
MALCKCSICGKTATEDDFAFDLKDDREIIYCWDCAPDEVLKLNYDEEQDNEPSESEV